VCAVPKKRYGVGTALGCESALLDSGKKYTLFNRSIYAGFKSKGKL
jgi:hypothetical protein